LEPHPEQQGFDGKPAWTAPVLRVVDLKEITKGHSGSFPEGSSRRRNRSLSDSRLKTDIAYIGTLPSGLGFYRFRYLGSPKLWVGVMAQEVLAVRPDAVGRTSNGYLVVDYDLIGVDCEPYDQWRARPDRCNQILH